MVRLIDYIMKKILGKKSMHEQLGSAYIEEDYGVGKDKYVFSSVFPNAEIMRKVDAIMTEGER